MAAVLRPSDPPSDAALPPTLAAVKGQLAAWLRALWNLSPRLLPVPAGDPAFDAAVPTLTPLGLHLPVAWPGGDAALHYRAAAAHAGAHLAYSRQALDGAGLKPITRALAGLLEDARAEWLACRELPGLRRLWLPLHEALRVAVGFEGLMQRLARSLLDPHCDDRHPWVLKGRQLFFVGGDAEVLALRQPADVLRAAMLLGHDIGQMRLQFNPRTYRPAPGYRDDNRWLWKPDATEAVAEVAAAARPAGPASNDERAQPSAPEPEALPAPHRYPEWDRLIARLRPAWSTVIDHAAPPAAEPTALPPPGPVARGDQFERAGDGDRFDDPALLQWALARRLHRAADTRLYRRRATPAGARSTLLLLDVSASTAEPFAGGPLDVLEAARRTATSAAQALGRGADRCAVHAFRSDGRHRVLQAVLKGFDEPAAGRPWRCRLAGLASGLSTRLGAALRHATVALAARGGRRALVVVTDGRPHDIDVHDPRYLPADARHAVGEALRRGIAVHCIVLDPGGVAAACGIFGAARVHVLRRVEALPALLARL